MHDHNLFVAAPLPVAELGTAERLACVRLIRSENVGPVTFRALINHFGGAEAALAAVPELSRRGGRTRAIRLCPADKAEAELERAEQAGAVPLFTIEPGYPAALAVTDAPPPLLYVKGDAALLDRPIVSIVGSRQCSAAGTKLARVFAKELGRAGYVVASGLAGGIDVVYPPEHDVLQRTIGEQGCLITEMPPAFVPRGKDFPRRNRIISGISFGVLIVEAARRSGTLVTARLAAEQGREVFAIPGHPLDPRAEGTNRLLKSGATLVTEPDDLLSVLAPLTGAYPTTPYEEAEPEQTAEPAPYAPLSDSDRDRVLAALGTAPIDIDSLVRGTRLEIRQVQVALIELALAGRIERHGSGFISLSPDGP